MKILITGGAGFVGSRLARTLLQRGTLDGRKIDKIVLGADGEPAAWNNSHWDYLTYLYDAFNADARAYLAEALFSGYGEAGTAAYWLDGDEPPPLGKASGPAPTHFLGQKSTSPGSMAP